MLLENILKFTEYEKIIGDTKCDIKSLGLCNRIYTFPILSYINKEKYLEAALENEHVKAVIIDNTFDEISISKLIYKKISVIISSINPEITFYKLHEKLIKESNFYPDYNFKSLIGENSNIAASAVISPNGVTIGKNVKIGHATIVYPGTSIGDYTEIGDFCSIGIEGFQIIKNGYGIPLHIKHAGGVSIGEHCYIGNHVDVCNSMFYEKTIIEKNCKIDNLIHIAHNCILNENVVLTAGTILCGSTYIERNAWIGTNSTIKNRITIGENCLIGIGSVVTKSTEKDSIVYGIAAKSKK